MKKKIAVLLVAAFLGSSHLGAAENFWGMPTVGGSIVMDVVYLLAGGAFIACPLVFGPDMYDYIYYGAGAICAVIGVVGLILDATVYSDKDEYALADSNPVLEHVSFAVLPDDNVYLGAHFKF